MKKGRRKDHIWKFCKYKGDAAIYAKCSCGFHYSGACCTNISEKGLRVVIVPEGLYPYCPFCGSRKTRYINEIEYMDKYMWE